MARFIYDIYDLRHAYNQTVLPSLTIPAVNSTRNIYDDVFVAWLLERLQYVFLIPLSNVLAHYEEMMYHVNPTPRFLHTSMDTWVQQMFANLNAVPYRSLALSHYTLIDNDLILELN